MINSRHTLSFCSHCECDMIVCADCGNNCCNGGTGDVDGKRCGCEEAYAHQDAYWKDRSGVQFVRDVR